MRRRRSIAKIALILAVLAWAACIVAVLTVPVSADPDSSEEENGRLPGDDIPATERCYVEDYENEKIEVALIKRATVIEDCTVTFYDPCAQCCGKSDGITASGLEATPYVTVAVDPSVIPLGSDVLVDYGDGEIHYYRADDTGPKGNHIDLCVTDHKEAIEYGVTKATVYWVNYEGE